MTLADLPEALAAADLARSRRRRDLMFAVYQERFEFGTNPGRDFIVWLSQILNAAQSQHSCPPLVTDRPRDGRSRWLTPKPSGFEAVRARRVERRGGAQPDDGYTAPAGSGADLIEEARCGRPTTPPHPGDGR